MENIGWQHCVLFVAKLCTFLLQNTPGDIPKGIESISSIASSGIQVSTRSISEYVKILGGEVNE